MTTETVWSDVLHDPPDWFERSVAEMPKVSDVLVAGTRISYRSWGAPDPNGRDLLLVHGGAAHAGWWDHIAPLLATDRRVTAIDLSGHGDSGHRNSYSFDGWADELATVIRHAGLADEPVVIGHSLGGLVTAVFAARAEPRLGGAIIVDSPIEASGTPVRGEPGAPAFGHARVYPPSVAPIDRFRPVPAQSTLSWVAKHIADSSTREVPGGWSWKFDPHFADMVGAAPRTLEGLPTRVVLIAGSRGILSPESLSFMKNSPEIGVIEIPDAGHAIMLDQPLALVTAIRRVLTEWSPR